MESSIKISPFLVSDIQEIVSSFEAHFWPKPIETFKTYWDEQKNGARIIWLAYYENLFAGYITLKFESYYKHFYDNNIPEIMDLNVLPPFRNKGIGSTLLDHAENEAFKKNNIIGLGVGLYKDYGSGQKIYVKRGYIPDGLGVTYNYLPIMPV
jgi:GNAT superfamily N-acetyltransferase